MGTCFNRRYQYKLLSAAPKARLILFYEHVNKCHESPGANLVDCLGNGLVFLYICCLYYSTYTTWPSVIGRSPLYKTEIGHLWRRSCYPVSLYPSATNCVVICVFRFTTKVPSIEVQNIATSNRDNRSPYGKPSLQTNWHFMR